MEMVWKTVTCSTSSTREAALSELGSAPQLDVDSCVGGSETRSTVGTDRYCGAQLVTTCIVRHSLQVILCSIGNQCCSAGIRLSRGRRLRTSRAAAFKTRCSGSVVHCGRLASTKFQ